MTENKCIVCGEAIQKGKLCGTCQRLQEIFVDDDDVFNK